MQLIFSPSLRMLYAEKYELDKETFSSQYSSGEQQ